MFNNRKKQKTEETMRRGAKLITWAEPQSPVSEQFRTIQTNINFLGIDKEINTIGFTSPNVSEGKSTVTANIAVAFAQTGKRVLLLDTDLRRPTVHATFGLANTQGLTTILTTHAEKLNVSEYIQKSGIENLSVLTSGPIPPNPAELLGSNKMVGILEGLKSKFDIVILDLAPILEVSDTQVLASQIDGIVLVIRHKVTQKLAVKRAIEMLHLAKVNIFGYVMNDIYSNDSGYGYGYGYGYYSNQRQPWYKRSKK